MTPAVATALSPLLRRMEAEGFLPLPLSDLVHFAADGAAALAYLREYA